MSQVITRLACFCFSLSFPCKGGTCFSLSPSTQTYPSRCFFHIHVRERPGFAYREKIGNGAREAMLSVYDAPKRGFQATTVTSRLPCHRSYSYQPLVAKTLPARELSPSVARALYTNLIDPTASTYTLLFSRILSNYRSPILRLLFGTIRKKKIFWLFFLHGPRFFLVNFSRMLVNEFWKCSSTPILTIFMRKIPEAKIWWLFRIFKCFWNLWEGSGRLIIFFFKSGKNYSFSTFPEFSQMNFPRQLDFREYLSQIIRARKWEKMLRQNSSSFFCHVMILLFLTWPCLSMSLLVSLTFSKETTCFRSCSPVKGESGWA